MIATATLIAVLAVAVAVLVTAESRGRRRPVLVAKPLASLAFVALGWARVVTGHAYDAWVLLALALCLAGDVLLMFRGAFPAGLAAFLLAHVAYIAAFATLLQPRHWPPIWAVPPLLASAAAANCLSPHLGRLRAAVLAYVTVITVMLWGSLAVTMTGWTSWLTAAGAALFYVSDLAVARDRFVVERFASRAWGLPAYYLGQLFLALSVGRYV